MPSSLSSKHSRYSRDEHKFNLTGNTASPVSGVATFNSLSFNIPGTGYALNASTVSTPAVTSATSTNFNVFGPAAKLAFTVQPPTSTAAGAIITPAITVTVQDGGGYTVANSTDIISMSIGTNPAAGNLGGTISVAASSGVAAFNNLTIDKPGTGYTLIATDNLLATPTVTSNLFNVVSGAITVSSISPNFGPIAGGTPVTITGTGFVSSGLTVTIGGIAAKNITLVSTTSITATTPAFATTGAQNVVVTTTGGSATLSNGFTYTLNWWGGDSYGAYHYRSLLTITNNTASVLAPYETEIIVTNNGHMNSNFSDVRFIANDNTAINNTAPVLYYWINPMPNPLLPSNEAEFWVNIPSIPAKGAGSVTIYMYYGNTTAVTTSDIHRTFIFGDDFENPTITTPVTGTTATPVVLDPYIQADNVGGSPTQQIISVPVGTGATATATVTNGAVTAVNVTNGGTGYSEGATVAFNAPAGSGAIAAAHITGGVITSIAVTTGGSGYTSAPTVTISPGTNHELQISGDNYLKTDATTGLDEGIAEA